MASPDSGRARPAEARPLAAICCQAAALASPVPVLLFHREEMAERLGVLGALTGESLLIGTTALIAVLTVPRLRDRLPAGFLLLAGGVASAAGLALMAWTVQLTLFVAGGMLLAAGSAPALVTHRILLANSSQPAVRFRTMSWYWAAATVGACWPLAVQVPISPSYGDLLWACCALTAAGALMGARHALAHDDDHETQITAARTDMPWARRMYAAAFAGGAAVIGGADAAQSLLLGEWQRSPSQTAAVLASPVAAGALISALGPWYHRLHRLTEGRRADAVGTQLFAAGALVLLGGLSFTYIGLVASWMVAGGALSLAAAGLDAAAFAAFVPAVRRALAARAALWVGIGGLGASLVNAHLIGAWSDQWKVAWLGLPLMAVGWTTRRLAPSARDAQTAVTGARATAAPRRVYSLERDGAQPHRRPGPGSPAGWQAPLLSVEQLSVAYGSVQVLFDVGLEVREGSVAALLGTNGAGKTTLLRAISGLAPTIGGRVVYAGLDITRTRPTWRVGMGLHQVVGGEAVVGPLTVAENLRLFGHGAPASRRAAGIAEAYDLFPRLAQRSQQRAATLSGGEKQMLSLARAIIMPPRLLLIDEFSLGLAPAVIADLLPVVRRIAERGAAVLLVEQSVNIALAVADDAYVMEKGEIGYSGAAGELRDRPNLVQSAYLEGLAHALTQDR
ncbi:ATP-binding cassette domain-containing protein [Candidatus Poriferisodalis sp.]|uniref:ATP-binding cassette domain-containing protein n=1 Tax=Candidatus Poriferisodalis sp. TaxID=3101277 RepID=UPI003B02CF20